MNSILKLVFFKVIAAIMLSSIASASLTLEDLNYSFASEGEYRSLSTEELNKLEEALYELGLQDYWNRFEDKIGHTDKAALSLYLRTCDLPFDHLGTYTRGETLSYRRGIMPNTDLSRPELLFEQDGLLETLNEAYQWHTENNSSYISLVIRSWPVICIRPGQSFGKTISTFVHELEHFLGDQYLTPDYETLMDERKYIDWELRRSGGEYNALLPNRHCFCTLLPALRSQLSVLPF